MNLPDRFVKYLNPPTWMEEEIRQKDISDFTVKRGCILSLKDHDF